jgi:hypothetical protein
VPPRSSKIDALIATVKEDLTNDPDARAVIFSLFTSEMDIIEGFLRAEKISHTRFDGDMNVTQRTVVLDDFGREVGGPSVLLMSIHAGGVGLNLTRATLAYFPDRWYNPAVKNQAQDRIHRIGQTKPCRVTFFDVEDSMDDALASLQKFKETQAEKVLLGIGRISGQTTATLGMQEVQCIMNGLCQCYGKIVAAHPEVFGQDMVSFCAPAATPVAAAPPPVAAPPPPPSGNVQVPVANVQHFERPPSLAMMAQERIRLYMEANRSRLASAAAATTASNLKMEKDPLDVSASTSFAVPVVTSAPPVRNSIVHGYFSDTRKRPFSDASSSSAAAAGSVGTDIQDFVQRLRYYQSKAPYHHSSKFGKK